MNKFEFLDKRIHGDFGEIIKYSSYEYCSKITEESFNLIKNNLVYKKLIELIPSKFVELYFKKLFFYQLLPIAHQITISNWDIKYLNLENRKIENINLFNEDLFYLLTIKENNFKNIKIKTSFFKKKLNKFIHNYKKIKFKVLKNFNKKFPLMIPKKIICINYVEGLDINKRSDVFWLNQSMIDRSNIFILFEDQKIKNKHVNKKKLNSFLSNLNIKSIDYWKYNFGNDYCFKEEFKKNCNNLKNINQINKYLYYEILHLLDEVSIWCNFFKKTNTKIYFDSNEWGLNTVIKQIALDLLNSCSVGKMRSYPNKLNGSMYGYYPNNIFFVWGRDNISKIKKSQNFLDNILISGYPYSFPNKYFLKINNKVDMFFKNNNIKYSILLLDNNHGTNKNLIQDLPTHLIATFYNNFFDLLLQNQNIALIIKTKKISVFNSIDEIKIKYDNVKKSGRCMFIEDPFQTSPYVYAKKTDLTVAISSFFSSSIIESVISGSRGIFFDYANSKKNLPFLYTDYHEKLIFNDLKKMLFLIKTEINNFDKKDNNLLGDWSKIITKYNHFNDLNGNKRIGKYVDDLFELIRDDINIEQSIQIAKKKFLKEWQFED